MRGYVVERKGRFYAVIYEGLDPITRRERLQEAVAVAAPAIPAGFRRGRAGRDATRPVPGRTSNSRLPSLSIETIRATFG